MTRGGFATEPADSMSSSLLRLIQAFDPEGWRKFVQLYGPLIFYWCRRAGLQESDAADVVQEVFRAVAASIDRFRRQKSGDTFRGWLRTIARSKLGDYFRRQNKEPAGVGGSEFLQSFANLMGGDGSSPDALSEEAASENVLLVRRAFELVQAEVEPRTWQAFWRTSIELVATADVAQALDMTPTAVRIAKSRVLRRLRLLLADE